MKDGELAGWEWYVCEGGIWTPVGYRKYGWGEVKGSSAVRTSSASCIGVASQPDLCLGQPCEMVQPDLCPTLRQGRKYAY